MHVVRYSVSADLKYVLLTHDVQPVNLRTRYLLPINTSYSPTYLLTYFLFKKKICGYWDCSRVVSVLDSGAEGPGFKSQPRRYLVTVLGKLFTPIVPLFTKQQNW